MNYAEEALRLHAQQKGKIVIGTKFTVETEDDLAVAYTPGVGAVSMAIAEDVSKSFELTNRINQVAIISDGSAVLGLGDIGPEAAMPVMEGKSLLFKKLANIDAFPLCLGTKDPEQIVNIVKNLVPSFAGINLEDIAAPACFYIEKELSEIGIPVFHDDQHGTAIVTLAGLINGMKLTGKTVDSKVVVSGAGAGGIATARLLFDYGFKNITLIDSKGIVCEQRTDLNEFKKAVLSFTNLNNAQGQTADAMKGSDIFIGLSQGGIIDLDMIKSMNSDSIVFAMANPTPEIMPSEAAAGGAKVIGTGRSDFPNQINNSLVFPGVFRGLLDRRATEVTTAMKLAAATAIASLIENPTYDKIVPSTLDPRVVPVVSKAVISA
ncbi:MAG TPA: NAD-dependent malic enzyme [Dehalococcoidia bacterium]|nr:NAD-dependent malic enzyme [Dehalococcoidia bacterium]|tara:strand:+ start:574 stop:1707 length:1134 start_codon:yes stop_codon:yes gene_type:complete